MSRGGGRKGGEEGRGERRGGEERRGEGRREGEGKEGGYVGKRVKEISGDYSSAVCVTE